MKRNMRLDKAESYNPAYIKKFVIFDGGVIVGAFDNSKDAQEFIKKNKSDLTYIQL